MERFIANARNAVGNDKGCQADASKERFKANACDAIADGYRSQTGAIPERFIANACDAIGNGDGGQTAAIIERFIAKACNAVSGTVVCYFFWNVYGASIFLTKIITCHHQLSTIIDVVVINDYFVIVCNGNIVGQNPCADHAHEHGKQNC